MRGANHYFYLMASFFKHEARPSRLRDMAVKDMLYFPLGSPRNRAPSLEIDNELNASAPDTVTDINIIDTRITWARYVARIGGMRNVHILIGELQGKGLYKRPRRRWKYNIKTHRREILYEGVGWIQMSQDKDQWRSFINTGSIKQKTSCLAE